MDKYKEFRKDEMSDEIIWRRIKDLNIVDTHSRECITCGLKTDFIFEDGKCELCRS